jgi:hypothetical protein
MTNEQESDSKMMSIGRIDPYSHLNQHQESSGGLTTLVQRMSSEVGVAADMSKNSGGAAIQLAVRRSSISQGGIG